MNVELAYKVLDYIQAHPEEWNQSNWMVETSCGTAYCFAGHATVLSGMKLNRQNDVYSPKNIYLGRVSRVACNLLELSKDQASVLFSGDNSFDDLQSIVEILSENPDIYSDHLSELLEGDRNTRELLAEAEQSG